MSFFDSFYDEMSWEEVSERLPSELAVNALKRRIVNLETLSNFVDVVNPKGASDNKDLKAHVNAILSNEIVDDILSIFPEEKHSLLFAWLDKSNSDRVKGEGIDKIGTKLAFNLIKDDDKVGLTAVLNKIMNAPELNASHVLSVLNKAKKSLFADLADIVIKAGKPEATSVLLSVRSSHYDMLSDMQRVLSLKAFAKCTNPLLGGIAKLDFRLFTELNPNERLTALDRYLNFFPPFKKMEVFNPSPSDEEVQVALFAGCIEFNEEVNNIWKKYNEIVHDNPPAEEEDEEDDCYICGSNCGGSCSANSSAPTPAQPVATAATATTTPAEEEDELELSDEPSDYYFKLDTSPNALGIPTFVITPKDYWNKTKCWYDGDMPDIEYFLESYKFGRLQESLFEFDGDPQKGRKALISLGFTENNSL